jgi:hypothetical protein
LQLCGRTLYDVGVRAWSILKVCFVSAVGLDCGSTTVAAESPLGSAAAIVAEAPPESPTEATPASDPAPASRYVAMSSDDCLAELVTREIDHARAPERAGIETPVRVLGPLSGVRFRTMLPEQERRRSLFELADCRLVLALDDFAKQLRAHNIVEVLHYSAYRPIIPGVGPRAHEGRPRFRSAAS